MGRRAQLEGVSRASVKELVVKEEQEARLRYRFAKLKGTSVKDLEKELEDKPDADDCERTELILKAKLMALNEMSEDEFQKEIKKIERNEKRWPRNDNDKDGGLMLLSNPRRMGKR